MADFELTADYKDLQLLRRELLGVGKDAQKSASVFETAYKKAETQLKKSSKAHQEFYNELLKTERQTKSAESSAQVFERELKKQEAEVERLSRAYKPLYAASKQYERSLEEIERALKLNILTKKQYETQLERLNQEFTEFSNGVARAGNQFARYDVAAYKSLQQTKRFASVGLQQVGYQVGDFAVQLQGGTNAAVAFGQQMSQLLGILGPYGAIAGAGVAIGTAFVAPLIDARKAARETQDSFEGLAEIVGQLERANLDNIGSALLESVKKIREEYVGIFDIMQSVALRGLKQNLDEQLQVFRDAYASFESRSSLVQQIGGNAPEFDILGFSDPQRFREAFSIINELSGDTKEELQESVKQIELFLRGSGLITDAQGKTNAELEQFLANLIDAVGLLESAGDEADRLVDSNKEIEDLFGDIFSQLTDGVEAYQELQEYYEQTSKSLADQIILQERINQFGEDSVIVKELEKQMELEKFEAMLKSKDLSDDLVRVLVRQYETLLDIKSVADQVDFSVAVRGATILAAQLGISLARLNAIRSGGGPPTLTFGSGVPGTSSQFDTSGFTITPTNRPIDLSVPDVSGGGGGGGGISEAQRELEQYVKSIEDDYAESLKTLDTEMAKLNKVYEDGLIDTNEYRYAQEQLRESYREFDDFIETQLLSTFDAVRTGTETLGQALLDFANNVLFNIADKIFQERVGSGFADAASDLISGLFFANGGVFNNGQVTPFASGGIVGSPTIFPMANGMGLMGEAGPEAIMPLKRNSKGALGVEASGGGTPVVVNIRSEVGGQPEVTQTGNGLDVLIKAVAADITQNGPVSRAISKKYTVNKRLSPR